MDSKSALNDFTITESNMWVSIANRQNSNHFLDEDNPQQLTFLGTNIDEIDLQSIRVS